MEVSENSDSIVSLQRMNAQDSGQRDVAIPQKSGERPNSGHWFNTAAGRVKTGEKADCFTLKRFSRLKCVKSEIKSNVEIAT